MTDTGACWYTLIRVIVICLAFALSPVYAGPADTSAAADSSKVYFPAGLTPLFEEPKPGGFPRSYLEPLDTCIIDSVRLDTLNSEWAFVRAGSRSGWLQKASLRIAGKPADSDRGLLVETKKMDADAKRRYRIVSEHPEWDRRIVKTVREGKICLDMTSAQLTASWGDPFQKSAAFILGAGRQDLWLYKNSGGNIETVFLIKGRVVGWSE